MIRFIKHDIMKIQILFITTLGLIFTSCDEYNFIHYVAKNKTNDSIKLSYSFGESYFDDKASDTSILLIPYQTDTLFIFEEISPSVYDKETSDNMIFIFNTKAIRLKDTMELKKDLTIRKNWKYYETSDHSAVIEFEITDNDF